MAYVLYTQNLKKTKKVQRDGGKGGTVAARGTLRAPAHSELTHTVQVGFTQSRHTRHPLSTTMSKDNNTDAQTAFDIDESKVFQACCCSFLGFYWPESGCMGCFGGATEGDLLCLGIGE